MGIEFPWPVSHCAVLYKIAKWGERTRAKWKRRYIHLPCLWLNGSICLWEEVTGRSGVWAKANYPSPLPLCSSPPLFQTHASNQPSLYERWAALSHWGCSVPLNTLGWVCESVWYSVIRPCGYHSHSSSFLYPFLTNVPMAGQQQWIIRNSAAIWRPMIPCLISDMQDKNAQSFFFFKPCYCDCTLVLTSSRTSAFTLLPKLSLRSKQCSAEQKPDKSTVAWTAWENMLL